MHKTQQHTKIMICTIHGQPLTIFWPLIPANPYLHTMAKQRNEYMATPTIHMYESVHKRIVNNQPQQNNPPSSSYVQPNKHARFYVLNNASNHNSRP